MKVEFRSYKILFFIALFVNLSALLFSMENLSISYYEADLFFNQNNPTAYLARFFESFFPHSDIGVRLPFLLFHLLNIFMLYKVSRRVLKRECDRVYTLILYMFLPGVMASAIVVGSSGIVIFFTLCIIYLYKDRKQIWFFALLAATLLIDRSFIILYISILLFGIYNKKAEIVFVGLALIFASVFFYDYNIGGRPKNYFLDTMGVFAAVFSPLVFLFFVYTIYRIWIKGYKEILWFISTSGFIICLILSFRQKLMLEEFLSFCVIATPLMFRVFMHSYRSRLPQYRKVQKTLFWVAISFLALNSFAIVFNQMLYSTLYSTNPKKHFIYHFDIVKELAFKLKSDGINEVLTNDEELALRLKFYGIEKGGELYLSSSDFANSKKIYEIKKGALLVDKFYLYK